MRKKRQTKPVQISLTDWPLCSILIPTYNEPSGVIEKTLKGATTQKYPQHKYEVLVIDDSTNLELAHSTEIIAKKYGAKNIHRTSRRGFKAGALNAGMKIAQGEYLLLLDSESTTPSDALQKLVPDFLFDPHLGYMQCLTVTTNHNENLITRCRELAARAFWRYILPLKDRLGLFLLFCGHNAMVKREAIEEVGGFNEGSISEDLDLSLNMRLKGWRGKYVTNVKMGEKTPSSFLGLKTQCERWSYGTTRFLMKNGRLCLFNSSMPLKERLDLFLNCLFWPVSVLVLLTLFYSFLISLFALPYYTAFPYPFQLQGAVFTLAMNLPIVSLLVSELRNGNRKVLTDLKVFPLTLIVFTALIYTSAFGSFKALSGLKVPFHRTPKIRENNSISKILKKGGSQIAFALCTLLRYFCCFPHLFYLLAFHRYLY
jgi:cellulose synthase/poly-beta-1,6-N-acetylglucosamine synthase-like glycosyltransferase